MTANLTLTIRRELSVLWSQAELAATTDVLYTKENAIESAEERITAAVRAWLLTREGMSMSTLLGYEAGKESRDDDN